MVSRYYAVVAGGAPLAKAFWTVDAELAQDMFENGAGPKEIWIAERIRDDVDGGVDDVPSM